MQVVDCGVVISLWKKEVLLRFQYGFKKVLILNNLSDVKVERIPDTKEAEALTIGMISDETIDLYK